MRSRQCILMYHRVATIASDPWQLAVEPSRFEEQLSVLNHHCQPLPLSEFVDRLGRGALPENAVSVTFDDGYADNLWNAKPRLEKAGIPATVFIATGSTGTDSEFWWDELARLVLNYDEDFDHEIEFGDVRFKLTRSCTRKIEKAARWSDWRRPRNQAEQRYLEIWRRLQVLSPSERDRFMSSLRSSLTKTDRPCPENLPMTKWEILELVRGGLVSIGGHSAGHPVLTTLSAADQKIEIETSKNFCDELVGADTEGFAYPHGVFNEQTQAIVRQAGFKYACSTKNWFIRDSMDLFALPRVQVLNWTGEEFENRLVDRN